MRLRILGIGSMIALLTLGALVAACNWGERGENDDLVAFDTLVADPQEYAGQYLCTEGVHIDGFEASGLAASMFEKEGSPQLTEPVIWLEGAEFRSREDCIQTDTSPPFEFCQAVVCGIFETGEGYGHGGAYAYQLRGRDVSAVPSPAATPEGTPFTAARTPQSTMTPTMVTALREQEAGASTTPPLSPLETPPPAATVRPPDSLPRQPEIISEGMLDCAPVGAFSRCVDEILNIAFEVPSSWGEIEAVLRTGGYAGYAYDYYLGGRTHAETEPLVAGGRSMDFSEGRGAMPIDFAGYGHGGLQKESACDARWNDSYPVCRQITSDVAWMIRFPTANVLCEGVFDSWTTAPTFRIEVNLPENPTINGFVFEAPFFSEQFADQVKTDLYPLLGIQPDAIPHKCDESSRQAFDAQLTTLLESITGRSADVETLENVDELVHLAESIAFRTSSVAPVPSWRQILFSYNHDGATELWTVDPASSETQRQIRPEQTVQDPALSPSGKTIAYVRVTGDYGGVVSELWLMDRDGGNPRPLYVPPADQSVLFSPTWQPEGQEVYFLRLGSGTESQLLRIPVTGGEPTTVLTDCIDFALSHDGQWLVSVSLGRQLTISGREGTRLRDLVPQGAAFAGYYTVSASPDGNLLAFRAVEAEGEDTWNLYVMDWAGGSVHRLTDLSGFHPFTRSSGQVNGLAWTADGAHLVYSVDGDPEQSGIWLVDIDDGERRRLFVWAEGEWAAVQGAWFAPSPQRPALTVDESPIVAAEVDGPGHFEYTDRLGEQILARIEGLRTHAAEQAPARANAALAPFGYRLEARFDAEWDRIFYDLLREGGAEPVLAGLSHVWPVSVNASGTDFVVVAENAPNVFPLYLQVQIDGVEPWDAELSNWLPPAYVDDALARVTFTGFPTLTYQVDLDNHPVYSGTAVALGAYMPLRSFTTWDGHWALEVDDHLIMDGQDLGQSLGYDAAFGFHLIQGQPFYFFQQDGQVRISFGGQTLPNVYDQVVHNMCCEASIHNVEFLGDVVLFHALWDGTWYFVQAGVYDGEMAGTYRYTAPEGWSFHYPMHWDRLDEELGFVQDTKTGKTVTFASQPTTRAELERWLESEIDRKLAATEAKNTMAEPLTAIEEGALTIYRYAILSRMDGSETLLRTTVFFDGQRRYEFYAAIPPLSEEEYRAVIGSFMPVPGARKEGR
jgi:Tol biopolymer transport system component